MIMQASVYDILKVIHICSGAIVFSSIFITALYWSTQTTFEAMQSKQALKVALFITLPAIATQLLTGFSIIGVQRYSMHQAWVWGTFLGFVLFTCTWLVSVYFLTQRRKKAWLTTLGLCLFILLLMLFMMANKAFV